MVSKEKVVVIMKKLDGELKKTNNSSELSLYIEKVLEELEKSEGVAFTGAYQQFLNNAPIVRSNTNINLNDKEKTLWDELFSMNKLGNNLWGFVGW